jgi:hypothetical protein
VVMTGVAVRNPISGRMGRGSPGGEDGAIGASELSLGA